MSQKQDDFLGEPISVYTDAEAIEDGFLADLTQFCVVQLKGHIKTKSQLTPALFLSLRGSGWKAKKTSLVNHILALHNLM